ncbi:Gag-Pol polyprotein [Plakobranchus ocellatus]|uniref:Gag-Pol polyprotein n=1 Tax=Plakobranchus ocellatus TaxID=259542 RepID=A0AAV4AAB7_9GAST|nr:Gag-Pol polyprotein [Plakobranchus ocellatus]
MCLRERFQIFGFEDHLCPFPQRIYTEPALHLDVQPILIKNTKVNLNITDNQYVQCLQTWEVHQVHVDISPSKQEKEDTSEVAYQKEFFRMKEKFSKRYAIYADGFKLEEKVAAAAFFPERPDCSKATRLRDGASVFSVELEGIALGLTEIKSSLNTITILLSALQSIQS